MTDDDDGDDDDDEDDDDSDDYRGSLQNVPLFLHSVCLSIA